MWRAGAVLEPGAQRWLRCPLARCFRARPAAAMRWGSARPETRCVHRDLRLCRGTDLPHSPRARAPTFARRNNSLPLPPPPAVRQGRQGAAADGRAPLPGQVAMDARPYQRPGGGPLYAGGGAVRPSFGPRPAMMRPEPPYGGSAPMPPGRVLRPGGQPSRFPADSGWMPNRQMRGPRPRTFSPPHHGLDGPVDRYPSDGFRGEHGALPRRVTLCN